MIATNREIKIATNNKSAQKPPFPPSHSSFIPFAHCPLTSQRMAFHKADRTNVQRHSLTPAAHTTPTETQKTTSTHLRLLRVTFFSACDCITIPPTTCTRSLATQHISKAPKRTAERYDVSLYDLYKCYTGLYASTAQLYVHAAMPMFTCLHTFLHTYSRLRLSRHWSDN